MPGAFGFGSYWAPHNLESFLAPGAVTRAELVARTSAGRREPAAATAS